jgi:copper chaperone NosL
MKKPTISLFTIMIAFAMLAASCGQYGESDKHPGPTIKTKIAGDITYGNDICEWCHEEIETVRYGAELITAGGKIYKFKAAEHMAAWMISNEDVANDANSVLVVDFADGQKLIDVKQALYLHSKLRPSPGKLNLTPINRDNQRMLVNIYDAYPGEYLEWDEVLELVKGAQTLKTPPIHEMQGEF